MDPWIAAQIQTVDKYIFIHQYEEASKILEGLLEPPQPQAMLLHFRRMELAARMDQQEILRGHYRETRSRMSASTALLDFCLVWLDQRTGRLDSAEAIEHFQLLQAQYGPFSAAQYGISVNLEQEGHSQRAVESYLRSIELDPDWTPAYFGLSQVYYRLQETEKGDYYFYLFEKLAPYNLYGNFETHQTMARECMEAQNYAGAKVAFSTLRDWWHEHKGACPPEVEVYEKFFLATMAEQEGDLAAYQQLRDQAMAYVEVFLHHPLSEDTRFFLYCTLEEFEATALMETFCLHALSEAEPESLLVKKIANHMFSNGKYVPSLFLAALQSNPDQPDLGFCALVAQLKEMEAPVEFYLQEKEKLKRLIENKGDPIEKLECLQLLMGIFEGDPEVHGILGDSYLEMENDTKAMVHYRRMMELQGSTAVYQIKYAQFLLKQNNVEEAGEWIEALDTKSVLLESSKKNQILGLTFTYYYKKEDYEKALFFIGHLVRKEPWNLAFLVEEIRCQIHLYGKEKPGTLTPTLERLLTHFQGEPESLSEDRMLQKLVESLWEGCAYELAYKCHKLCCLFFQQEEPFFHLVRYGNHLPVAALVQDFLKLLNTNLDGPEIYFSLGLLYKSAWQLETATSWLENGLSFSEIETSLEQRLQEELADCYVWRESGVAKGVELAKVYIGENTASDFTYMVAAHGALKLGKSLEASLYLKRVANQKNFESLYLQGLVLFRNGQETKAREMWKPLIASASENMRTHHMKEQLLQYYFHERPYSDFASIKKTN